MFLDQLFRSLKSIWHSESSVYSFPNVTTFVQEEVYLDGFSFSSSFI